LGFDKDPARDEALSLARSPSVSLGAVRVWRAHDIVTTNRHHSGAAVRQPDSPVRDECVFVQATGRPSRTVILARRVNVLIEVYVHDPDRDTDLVAALAVTKAVIDNIGTEPADQFAQYRHRSLIPTPGR